MKVASYVDDEAEGSGADDVEEGVRYRFKGHSLKPPVENVSEKKPLKRRGEYERRLGMVGQDLSNAPFRATAWSTNSVTYLARETFDPWAKSARFLTVLFGRRKFAVTRRFDSGRGGRPGPRLVFMGFERTYFEGWLTFTCRREFGR